jgi:DNA polymerase-3 subunit gamma/tau
MSYQVLARKYRPKSFETLVGQEHVVRALTHALEQQRLHHAYLFTGTRGVGKTTLSRILAKSLNCEQGVTAHPCGKCEACVAIDAGRFVDYIEMDAASNRGVDEMAQLLEQAIYAPSNARFKVYMIDEVHMLTNHAFNSMLKTLEEPPEHVKFILATTDPQKIPVTVLSRCLQFNLKQMPPGHIVGHLDNILGQEQIEFEAPALRLLAAGAHGSMRDALSLTDQAIAYAAGKVSLEAVQGMLGALDQSYLIRVLEALAAKDGAGLLAVADEMATRSLSYNAALQDLAALLHKVALAQSVPAAIAEDLPERADIMRLAGMFDAEELQLFYQIAVHGRNDLGLAPDEYAGFSMTLLRMLAFRPGMGGVSERATGAPTANIASSARPVPAAAQAQARAQAMAQSQPAQSPQPQSQAQPQSQPQPQSQAQPAARLSAAPQVAATSAPVARPPSAMSPARAALEAARNSAKNAANGGQSRPAAEPITPVATENLAPQKPVEAQPQIQPQQQSRPQPVPTQSRTETPPPGDAPPWLEDMPMSEPPPYDFPMEAAARDAEPVAEMPRAVAEPVSASQPMPRPVQTAQSITSAPADVKEEAKEAVKDELRAEIKEVREFAPSPITALQWDGNWPALAATLPVRGVAQQLAQQSELLRCDLQNDTPFFHLRVAVETLLSSGSVDKLIAALSERFGRNVRVTTEIGSVKFTANAAALADREALQRRTEEMFQNDPFVLKMFQEFGATIMPGSVKPA